MWLANDTTFRHRRLGACSVIMDGEISVMKLAHAAVATEALSAVSVIQSRGLTQKVAAQLR